MTLTPAATELTVGREVDLLPAAATLTTVPTLNQDEHRRNDDCGRRRHDHKHGTGVNNANQLRTVPVAAASRQAWCSPYNATTGWTPTRTGATVPAYPAGLHGRHDHELDHDGRAHGRDHDPCAAWHESMGDLSRLRGLHYLAFA